MIYLLRVRNGGSFQQRISSWSFTQPEIVRLFRQLEFFFLARFLTTSTILNRQLVAKVAWYFEGRAVFHTALCQAPCKSRGTIIATLQPNVRIPTSHIVYMNEFVCMYQWIYFVVGNVAIISYQRCWVKSKSDINIGFTIYVRQAYRSFFIRTHSIY